MMYHKNKKDQTISKANYGLLNSPKKRTKCTQDTILSAFRLLSRLLNWPLITLNDKKLSKSFWGASNINVQKKTCVSTYTLCPKLNWYMIERTCPRALIRIIIQIRKRYTTSLSLWQKMHNVVKFVFKRDAN